MGRSIGQRAVVLGGGIAGLLAARVLTDAYREVVVVDRDRISDAAGPRRGVPHDPHAHALQPRGQQVLEELFPGFAAELAAAGRPVGEMAGDLRWYFLGQRIRPAHAGLVFLGGPRPELEAHLRARVAGLSTVDIRDRRIVRGLATTSDGTRVTGVHLVRQSGGAAETLEADLVVDATGRGSRTPAWLVELGYRRPAEDRVKVDLAYTTRRYRLTADPFGSDLSINSVASPLNPRGAFFIKLPGGTAQLSLTGVLGDHPPTDPEGFLAFAETLSAPEIHAAVKDSEPLDDPVMFRFPASVRRRYERLERFPAGLLVVGDAVCSFNPVYGQGMTVAALEALDLRRLLQSGAEPDPRAFFKAIAPAVDAPWDIAAGGDLAFPDVEGPRPAKVRIGNAYLARLQAAAVHDAKVTEAFFRVAGLVDPPQALFRPGLVYRVFRALRRSRRGAPDTATRPVDVAGRDDRAA
jgi:2-polyprenyl-6-methoxyphenol hydroxylase-like FAD-dependent oxidoreductase